MDDEEGTLTTQNSLNGKYNNNDNNTNPFTERSPLLPRRNSTVSTTSTAKSFIFLGETCPARFWLIFAQILISQFMAAFDGTLMASSHPVITSHFKAANSASWLSTAFLLTSTTFQPLLGRLSDAVGRKPLFVASIGVFTLATMWCALAGSIESFIAARALCGLGAGGVGALGSIITSDLVPIEYASLSLSVSLKNKNCETDLYRRRGTYQSYVTANFGAGSALGAALGGAMAEALGWRWEFGVQVPPLLLCMAMSAVVIPDDIGLQGPRRGIFDAMRQFDFGGSALLTVSTTTAILGLVSHQFILISCENNVMELTSSLDSLFRALVVTSIHVSIILTPFFQHLPLLNQILTFHLTGTHPVVLTALSLAAIAFPSFLWFETRAAMPIMPFHLIQKSPRANLIFANFIAAVLANAISFNM